MNNLAKMSNQERVGILGLEEASKYHGPYERREPLLMLPALSREGAQWHDQREWSRNIGLEMTNEKIPRECVYNTKSFKGIRRAQKAQAKLEKESENVDN